MTDRGESVAKRRAYQFFGGGLCVLTSDKGEWHHLDENHLNWQPWNIVPLRRDLNQEIENLRNSGTAVLSPQLNLASIRQRAANLFDGGRFRASYGASRLAYFLSVRLDESTDMRLLIASEALTSLRPSPDPDYLRDLFERTLLPTLGSAKPNTISPETRQRVVTEIGALLRDYDLDLESRHVIDARKAPLRRHDTNEATKQAVRQAHTRASVIYRTDPREAVRILTTSIDLAGECHFAFGIANARYQLAETALAHRHLDDAERWLQEAKMRSGKARMLASSERGVLLDGTSWWALAILLEQSAVSDLLRARTVEAKQTLEIAAQVYSESRIRRRLGLLDSMFPSEAEALQRMVTVRCGPARSPSEILRIWDLIKRTVQLVR